MATCRYCGRGGLFRSVDGNGLCTDCRRPVLLSIASTARVVTESLKLTQTGKTLVTRIGRWGTVIEHAERLVAFEQRGIPTITPPPTVVVAQAREERKRALVIGLTEDLDAAESRAELASTPTARLNAFEKVIHLAEQYQRDFSGDEPLRLELAAFEARARNRHHEVRLENMLDVAKKAEFKGQTSKAIDAYRDVLYELQRGLSVGENRAAEIVALERLIAELQATQAH